MWPRLSTDNYISNLRARLGWMHRTKGCHNSKKIVNLRIGYLNRHVMETRLYLCTWKTSITVDSFSWILYCVIVFSVKQWLLHRWHWAQLLQLNLALTNLVLISRPCLSSLLFRFPECLDHALSICLPTYLPTSSPMHAMSQNSTFYLSLSSQFEQGTCIKICRASHQDQNYFPKHFLAAILSIGNLSSFLFWIIGGFGVRK